MCVREREGRDRDRDRETDKNSERHRDRNTHTRGRELFKVICIPDLGAIFFWREKERGGEIDVFICISMWETETKKDWETEKKKTDYYFVENTLWSCRQWLL